MLDNVLVSTEGFCDAAAAFYAKGHDLKDPLISPIYGDMSGFPPTILTSGTRDLLLSNTVRSIASFATSASIRSCRSTGSIARALRSRRSDSGGAEAFTEIGTFLNSHLKK